LQQYLQKFLILHRKLSIPQLGSFVIEDEPARLDVESGLLFAPRPVIRFSETDRPVSDKLFFRFLAEEMQVDELAAIREFHDFCYAFRSNLQSNQMASIQGIGRVVKRSDDVLGFSPETNLLEFLPPVPWTEENGVNKKSLKPLPAKKELQPKENETEAAPPEQQEEEATEPAIEEVTEEWEEDVVTDDRWWIYALILAGIGILALLNYYRLFASIL
jgi:hypothetical protein